MTYLELANFINDFLAGAKKQGPYEWEDFTIFKSEDPNIEKVRQKIIRIAKRHPAENPKSMWCSQEGEQALRELAESLRNGEF